MINNISLNTQQLDYLKEIFSDGDITQDELTKAKQDSISERLISELIGKSTEEREDYFNKLLNKEIETDNQSSSEQLSKSLVAGSIGGVLGGTFGGILTYLNNNIGFVKNFKYSKAIMLGALVGGIAIGISSLVSNKDVEASKEQVDEVEAIPHWFDRSRTTEMPEIYKNSLVAVAKKMGIGIDELKEEIKKASEQSGYSEYFITHLISMEHYEPKPRDTDDGTITAGFGHTKLRDKSLTMKTKVTPQIAFNWLANDIKYFEKIIKAMKLDDNGEKTIGDYWDTLPPSLKEATIDVAFNRDASKIQNSDEYKSLRANIIGGEENYPACAVRLRQEFDDKYTLEQQSKHKFTPGLRKRNCYRFLLAIRDLDDEYRAVAKRRFEKSKYYSNTIEVYKLREKHKQVSYQNDIDQLTRTWERM